MEMHRPSPARKPVSVCFFVWLTSSELFEIVDFYRNDIRILRELGYRVHLASKPSQISWDADLYITWWWAGGLPTLIPSVIRRRPNIFFGAHHFFQPGWDFQTDRFHLRTVLKRVAMRWAMRLATANVFISPEELRVVEHLLVRNPSLVPLAVDHHFYRPDRAAPGEHLLTITHLTRANVERKMVCELIEAFAYLLRERPDERLVIIGEKGDGYARVQEAATRLGIAGQVDCVGRIDTHAKLSLLQRAKMYLQPTRYEGFGLAIAEAMACERPVVVTLGGAVADTVGACGAYARAHTPEAIAQACLGVLRDPMGAAAMGRAARARVIECFSYERRKERIRSLLENVALPRVL